jgi:hypothetical protein
VKLSCCVTRIPVLLKNSVSSQLHGHAHEELVRPSVKSETLLFQSDTKSLHCEQ